MKSVLPLVGPDPSAVRALRLVGRYALGVDWQDGHQSIYPFEQLRGSCPCPDCGGSGPSSPVASADAGGARRWPVAIQREGPGLRISWQDGHESPFVDGRALRALCACAACRERPGSQARRP